MDVKKCDRCGQIYALDETNVFKTALADLEEAIFPRSRVKNIALHLQSKVDLCDDCVIDFEKWWCRK